jgi:hypothetical protein
MINYKTVKLIDGDDFNSLVRETYGKPYFLQQQNYCMRGLVEIAVPPEDLEDFENESLENPKEDMGVSFKAWLEKEPEGDDYRVFWERHFYPSLDMVVNDLYEKGLIEEGEYYINLDV